MHDGTDVAQRFAKFAAKLHQFVFLRSRDFNKFRQLGAQNLTLGFEGTNLSSEFLLAGSGDAKQQKMVKILHDVKMPKSLAYREMTSFLHCAAAIENRNIHHQHFWETSSPVLPATEAVLLFKSSLIANRERKYSLFR